MPSRFYSFTFILFFIIVSFKTVFASSISGIVTDKDSVSIPFATIYVKNTTYGGITNHKGNYFIDLTPGKYTMVYSCVGYESIEKEIIITENQNLMINIVLPDANIVLESVEIVADKIDRAQKIMRNARDNRRLYLTSIENFECISYVKTSIEKETEQEIIDSTINSEDYSTYLKNEKLNLIEYIAQTFYKQPDNYKENILAYHNYTEEKPVDEMVISIEYGETNIAPENTFKENPFIFYQNSTSGNFNFYQNLLDFPVLCEQPLVSPIAYNSALFYKFEYQDSFFEDSTKITKIKVTPLNNSSALFYGNIYIEDSTWALVSVDLFINEKALTLYHDFNIIQNYKKIDTNIYLPARTDITYTIQDNQEKILGSSKIIYKEFKVNQEINPKTFSNEVITYTDDAFDKDSVYWSDNRPVSLKYNELDFINKTDSLQEYYISDEYLNRQDSIFNAIRWWSPFIYFGYRNHFTGIEFTVGGLIQQVVPFGVGGYRHKLPVTLNKRFTNGMFLETNYQLDYGFVNKDFKGKIGVGFTYLPKKFVRTFIEIGDTYDLINNYASLEQTFSRSNYARNRSISVAQRMEVFNGFYAELSFTYSNQMPINEIQLERWSDFLFGDLNEPIEFEQYIKSELKLECKYRIGQKYVIRKNQKFIIGNDYPEISLIYRKGINGLFNSEVDFDYIEIGAKNDIQLARFGESRWQVKAGMFISKKDLRLLEYKYFRGSDVYLFSDPVNSMQLVGKTLNTNFQYLQANYIHHFNGLILNKVPLVKYLKLSVAAGAGTLLIPEQNFYHLEMFAGVERIFKIRKQLFRFGVYAVTADNTMSTADIKIKFGISYFDDYKDKWSY